MCFVFDSNIKKIYSQTRLAKIQSCMNVFWIICCCCCFYDQGGDVESKTTVYGATSKRSYQLSGKKLCSYFGIVVYHRRRITNTTLFLGRIEVLFVHNVVHSVLVFCWVGIRLNELMLLVASPHGSILPAIALVCPRMISH